MKASIFAVVIALLYIISTTAGVFLIYNGYGIPSRFKAIYWLDSYELLIGVGEQAGKPVIYEWTVTTLLRPGTTKINISILSGLTASSTINTDNIVIQFYFNEKVYEAAKPHLNITISRNNVFFIGRVRLIIFPDKSVPRGSPVVYVNITSLGRT
ncbi:MAG: hypothetical protein ABWW65_00750 [Thermoprotei archaeon]